jgi:hypothetical protein
MSIYHTYQMIAESGLGISNFTSITIYENCASVIGYYSKELYDNCKSMGYQFEWDNGINCLIAKNEVLRIHLFIK